LPDETQELERCAIRSGYEEADRAGSVNRFLTDLRSHTKVVHDLFRSFFENPKSSPIFKATVRAMKIGR
jgi:glutamate-ammonia-ligase adenylyltransferase